jgi:DNA uptake protein ComE-like DNA-binding protein
MKAPIWFKPFNRSQRNAILFLLGLQSLLLFFPDIGDVSTSQDLDIILDTLQIAEIFPEEQKETPWEGIRASKREKLQMVPRVKSYTRIDINAADSAAWKQFRGIGSVLAGRIIKFRDKLGGFVAIEQVAETYGLPDSVYRAAVPYLYLEKAHQKLDINQADLKTLVAHPYIEYPLALGIVRLREKTGKLEQEAQLFEKFPEWEAQIRKLLPYISW